MGPFRNSICFLSLLLIPFLSVSGESNLYEPPSALIDPAAIERAEALVADPAADPLEAIALLTQQLKLYSRQFVENKRIEDERRSEALSYKNMDVNMTRLISLFRHLESGRGFFIGESPYLFRIHSALARAYERLSRNSHALNHYVMALRYVTFDGGCRVDPAGEKEKEALYLAMARTFADGERIKEEGGRAAQAAQFRTLITEYVATKKRYEEAVKRVDVAEAELVRGTPRETPDEARSKRDALKQELDAVSGRLEAIRQGEFQDYCTKKGESLASNFYAIASLLDREEKDGKKSGNARVMMLEMTLKVDPTHEKAMEELIVELKNTRRNERAIDLEEKFIAQSKGSASPLHYRRLGGLYLDVKNYLKGAEALERYLSVETDGEKKREAILLLANTHFRRTGRIKRANELYQQYLKTSPPVDPNGEILKRSETRKLIYGIHRSIASIYRREQRSDREIEHLNDAIEQVRIIEKELDDAVAARDELQKQINTLKLALMEKEDPGTLREYYRLLRLELPDRKQRVDFIRSRLRALHHTELLERLAFLAQRERDFRGALTLYAEIIRKGRGAEVTRARKNIDQIEATLNDGIYREPALPPAYER